MGREGHETTVVCSSIALLQERFRQVQREKEMREERELLRTSLSEPNNNNMNKVQFNNLSTSTNVGYEPSRLFFHPDLFFPRKSITSQKVSLSLWPSFGCDFEDEDEHRYYFCSGVEKPVFKTLWPLETPMLNTCDQDSKDGFCETDVDTSLHL